MENDLKSCTENKVASNASKVEISLDTLRDKVSLFGKLSNEMIELIQSPRPAETCCISEGQACSIMPNPITLSQQIDRLSDRMDDSNQRLVLAVDIIRQNLGEIKLD
jgi:hypothetical protein